MTRGRLYLAILAGWVALALTLTSIPNPGFGPSFPGADKIAHFCFYGAMGFLSVLCRREIGTGGVMAVVWAADFAGGTSGGFCSAVAASMLPFLLTPKRPPFFLPAKD